MSDRLLMTRYLRESMRTSKRISLHSIDSSTATTRWAAAGFKDTELGVFMKSGGHGATQVYARVKGTL